MLSPTSHDTMGTGNAGFMIFAAVIELILGIRAEGQSLENVATPLTAIEEATGKSAASGAAGPA